MSHIPERKEKDCLNCGTIVEGRYCQHCGQENVVPKETFWHMVTHFFYDITHFDSSFFHTIHHLILKPGFLSREYMLGRRVTYLHPIRMYVFMSAIFFLLFFTFFKPEANLGMDPQDVVNSQEKESYVKRLQEGMKKDTGNILMREKLRLALDTNYILHEKDKFIFEEDGFLQFGGKKYKNIAEYDSIERTLPPGEKDGWFMRRIMKRAIAINVKYRYNPQDAGKEFFSGLLHKLPYMLFVSLPLFAFILWLVYIRRRKQFYFADHGVFTIHLYVFTFIWLLVLFSLRTLQDAIKWNFIAPVTILLFLSLLFYLYRGMKNFYRQSWGKTFIKFLLVTLLSGLMMLVLLIFFILFSVFTL